MSERVFAFSGGQAIADRRRPATEVSAAGALGPSRSLMKFRTSC
jgi:hypothetical protein